MSGNSSREIELLASRLPGPNYTDSFREAPRATSFAGSKARAAGAGSFAGSGRGTSAGGSGSRGRAEGSAFGGTGLVASRKQLQATGERVGSQHSFAGSQRPSSAGTGTRLSSAGVRTGLRDDPPGTKPNPGEFVRKGSGSAGGSRPRTAQGCSGGGGEVIVDPANRRGGDSSSSSSAQRASSGGGGGAGGGGGGAPSRPRPLSARGVPGVKASPTRFSMLFDRGDLPIVWAHEGATNGIKWKNPVSQFTEEDYLHLIPLFFEGLREPQEKHRFLAVRGAGELVAEAASQAQAARGPQEARGIGRIGEKLVPMLVPQARQALMLKDPQIAGDSLSLLMTLLRCPGAGVCMASQLRPLLTALLALKDKHKSIQVGGDRNKRTEFRELLWDFLGMCETKGGEKAYATIKSCIPDYMRTRKRSTALLVDPNRIEQKEGTSVLKRMGYEVMVTGVMDDAILVAQQQGKLDLLVVDAGTRTDGVKLFYDLTNLGFKPKAVALSATANGAQRDEYLHSGFAAYLTKPLDSRRLEAALAEYERRRATHESGRQLGASIQTFAFPN